MTEPPGPGRSPPPLIQVGCRRSASSIADHAALAHPHGPRPGVGRQAVDVVERRARRRPRRPGRRRPPARAGSRISRRPIAERPMPESTDRCSNRSADRGGRGVGRWGSGTRSVGSSRPVGSNSGSQTSSCCSKRTWTSWPMWTSSGSQPTTLVVRWTLGSSARATLAIAYGGSKSGSHWCWLTVRATTVARAGDLGGRPRPAAAHGADGDRGVDHRLAVVAPLDAQAPVGARRPEPLVGRGELGQGAHGDSRVRGRGRPRRWSESRRNRASRGLR